MSRTQRYLDDDCVIPLSFKVMFVSGLILSRPSLCGG